MVIENCHKREFTYEIERLRAAIEEILDNITMAEQIARVALDHGLPTFDDVRGILKSPDTK